MYTFITALMLAASFTSLTSVENITPIVKLTPIQSVIESKKLLAPRIFKIYGELSPVNYLNGGEDKLTSAYGFLVVRVAGCGITPELEQSVKENNRVSNEQMMAYFREDWKENFEKKTGIKFVFPEFP
jgi:hypothetical protein